MTSGAGEIFALHRARMRIFHVAVQEGLTVLGISVGVGLLLAGQIASESLDSSVRALGSRLLASAQYQLDARSASGFGDGTISLVRRISGVRSAVPVLERQVIIDGRCCSDGVDLVGVGSSPFEATRRSEVGKRPPRAQQVTSVLRLPEAVASAIDAHPGELVTIRTGTSVRRAIYAAPLRGGVYGALRESQVAVGSLEDVQRLTGLPKRVTRIYIRLGGDARRTKEILVDLAARRNLNLRSADWDVRAFAIAASPAQNGEQLFAAISAVVGFVLAFNAMLLSAPERAQLFVGLRRRGWNQWTRVRLFGAEAALVALLACLLGVALAKWLTSWLFDQQPAYLSFAFPVGSGRQLNAHAVAVSVSAGFVAAFAGVVAPLASVARVGLREGRPTRLTAAPWLRLVATCALLCVAVLIATFSPGGAVIGSLALLAALLLALPVCLSRSTALFRRVFRTLGMLAGRLAVIELSDPAAGTRLLAVAATGAVALFGSTSVLGARANLKRGLDRTSIEWSELSPLWVYPADVENTLLTTPFPARRPERELTGLADVASVGIYRGGFLDLGARRLWVIAPPAAGPMIAPRQITSGDPGRISRLLRGRGSAVLSEVSAAEMHLRAGDSFTLPSPSPVRLRISGLSTNSGWPPGTLLMNATDYARAFDTIDATALAVTLRPGVTTSRGRSEVAARLGRDAGLVVKTSQQRARANQASSKQALSQLGAIATLVLVAAALAMSGVMGSAIWQRRRHLVALKRQGYGRRLLWGMLLCECAVLTGVGSLLGALFGLLGQLLLSRALGAVTGFPIAVALDPLVALRSLAVVCGAATAIVAAPGYLLARSASVRRV